MHTQTHLACCIRTRLVCQATLVDGAAILVDRNRIEDGRYAVCQATVSPFAVGGAAQ